MLEEMNKRSGGNADIKELMKETRELTRYSESINEKLNELRNDRAGRGAELDEKIENLKDAYESEEGKSASERFSDLCKALLELAKILASIFSIWFMYNMVNYIFSDCYWIPTAKECTFVGQNADQWKNLQTAKKRMQKADTMDFESQLFMQNNDKASCICQADGLGLIVARAPTDEDEHSDYGIIETSIDGQESIIGQNCLHLSDKSMGSDNTIACPGGPDRRSEQRPVCLQPKDSSNDLDVREMELCGGSYQFYNCDLGAMADKFAQLVDDAVNTDFMGIIKLIVYIVVGIIVFYLLITIIRLIYSNRNS